MTQPPKLPDGPTPVIPYATPLQYNIPSAAFRDGKQLVVPQGGTLPMRCVKCNQPAIARYAWTKTLYWHHPALYFLIFFPGILIYAIIALVIRKKIKVTAGLCELHGKRRRKRVLWGWLIALAGLGAVVAAIYFGNDPSYRRTPLGGTFALLGILLILASLIWALVATRVVWAKKIDDRFAWLNGAGSEFLDSIPHIGQ